VAWTETTALQEQVTQAIAEEYARAVHGIPLVHDFAQRLATAALAAAEPTIRAQERERLARWRKNRYDRSISGHYGGTSATSRSS